MGETATFAGNDSFVCSMFCVFEFIRLHGFDRVASSYIGLTEFPGEAFDFPRPPFHTQLDSLYQFVSVFLHLQASVVDVWAHSGSKNSFERKRLFWSETSEIRVLSRND